MKTQQEQTDCRWFITIHFVKDNFAVSISIAPPKITSISPLSGNVGSLVSIIGSGFNTTPSLNTVYFGSVKATVTSASYTNLIAAVPVSSNYQKISVTNMAFNLTGYSNLPFNITFPVAANLTLMQVLHI
ncbi:MAG: IPT/TIG domain-containing protein [Ignavibacteria bacterium]|nr:IPT/TIG domain-containing protein [Ignavibacteria bacterium]